MRHMLLGIWDLKGAAGALRPADFDARSIAAVADQGEHQVLQLDGLGFLRMGRWK